MPVCGQCGGVNPDEDRFCSDCGTALGAGCPACGATVAAGKRFCGQCGTALTTADARPAPAAGKPSLEPVAERRVCSVLFCDLVGFTPLSEARDAEEVRELLSRYFDMARTVISRYGGVVEKFIGDAVMAVWGTPVTLEGDTERAVRAALELVDAVAALGASVDAPALSARAGVVTGEVAVTLGATNEGMVAGDVVNTASRVQSAAKAGTVLVDESTKRLAQAAVAFADAGEHELKGKSEPQPLWRALRVLSGVGGVQRVDGLEAPLTGRDAELRMVKDLFHASVDRRQARLLLLSGPAGVGKSRIGWEFEKYVDGLRLVAAWHRGRCLSYGDGVAFWALAEIVRQRLGIAEEDPLDVAAAKLDVGLDTYVTDPQERQYIGVRLSRLLGVAFPDGTGQELAKEELFAGWRLWFERITAQNPVILLVEDAHHADPGLLDFLEHLVDWARDAPIFVLLFSRPELELNRPGLGSGRNRSLLALDPLDGRSMRELLDALVPGMPDTAMTAIAEHAQGIPLFAVETVRSLIDRDIVVPQDGVYRLVAEVGPLTVPDSLHGLLAARLDALEPQVRALIADAAVLGSSFPVEALVAVSKRPDAEVREALDELVRREVLSISADPLSPQRGTYRFDHEMLRRVAYDTLSRRDRKTRHLAVAAHLRAAFPGDADEVVDVLAQHYLDALSAVPDDDDAEHTREQAVAALTRTGERAERTGALDRAAASYAAAGELVAATARPDAGLAAAGLAERAAAAAFGAGEWTVAVDYADRASSGYRDGLDPRSAARAQVIAGHALRSVGRHADARDRLKAALDVLSDAPDVNTVRAMQQLGSLEVFAGTEDADRLTEQALTLGQALGVGPEVLSGLFTTRGIYLGQVGRRVEAAAMMREAARLAEQEGATSTQGIALLNLSDVLGPFDPPASAEAARNSAELLRRAGYRNYLAYALMNFASASLGMGDWRTAEEAVSVTAESYGVDSDEGITCFRAFVTALLGNADAATTLLAQLSDLRASEAPQEKAFIALAEAFAAAASGQTAEALRHGRRTLDFVPALGISGEQPRWAWPLAARAAYELRDSSVQRELLGVLDASSPGHRPPMLVAERALVVARLAAADGDANAGELFADAMTALRDRSTPYHLAQGLLDYADHLARTGDTDRRGAMIDEALRLATELRAQAVIDRAEQARSSSVTSTVV